MHSMQDNAHALVRSKEGGDANDETERHQSPPSAICRAECDDNAIDYTSSNTTNAKAFSEHLSWWIAIADGPPDEVGMSLMAEGPLNSADDFSEGRRMSCDGQGAEQSRLFLGG